MSSLWPSMTGFFKPRCAAVNIRSAWRLWCGSASATPPFSVCSRIWKRIWTSPRAGWNWPPSPAYRCASWSACFKTYLGATLGAFQLKLRLEQARTLLHQTELSMVEIAVATGFANASHFAHAYRRRFGRTPRSEALRSLRLIGRRNPSMEAAERHALRA